MCCPWRTISVHVLNRYQHFKCLDCAVRWQPESAMWHFPNWQFDKHKALHHSHHLRRKLCKNSIFSQTVSHNLHRTWLMVITTNWWCNSPKSPVHPLSAPSFIWNRRIGNCRWIACTQVLCSMGEMCKILAFYSRTEKKQQQLVGVGKFLRDIWAKRRQCSSNRRCHRWRRRQRRRQWNIKKKKIKQHE